MNNRIYLVNKEVNYSSQKYINLIKWKFHCEKIGHCGTLDPFASGLLIVFTNEATKIARFIEKQDKTYVATLRLGIKTDSGDITGKTIENREVRKYSKEEILNVLNSFIGDYYQVPPMLSALRVNGERLYYLARNGIEIEREARLCNIFSIELLDYKDDRIYFKTKVSKGTYIRTLGEDIAAKLDTIGTIEKLERTAIGNFKLEDSSKLDEIDINKGLEIKDVINLPRIVVKDKNYINVINGHEVNINYEGDLVIFTDINDKELAIYKYENNQYVSDRGFKRESF